MFGEPTLAASPAALTGRTTTLRGVLPAAANKPVTVQRRTRTLEWETLGAAPADDLGTFALPWKADRAGRYDLRTLVDGAPVQAQAASVSAFLPTLTVYRPAKATWYGPGFYGNRTACGQRMSRTLRGVAHKTLPCGTVIELHHAGHTVTTKVVDRGPFRPGVAYDLTAATARDLEFDGLATIGTLRAPARR